MATRNFFRKAPRLRPDLCKQPSNRPINHKGKVVVVRMSNGQTRFYSSAKWAHLQGVKKGGRVTAALGTGHKFTTESGRKAALKMWKKRPVNGHIGVRLGIPANRRPREQGLTPIEVAHVMQVKGSKKDKV